MRVISEACVELGIESLTLFAFSTENWYRPEGEVSMLMDLMRYVMRTDLEDLHAQGVKLRIIGDRSRFAPDIAAMMDECEALTQHNQRLNLNVAVNYGGRWDIVEATKQLALQVQSGEVAVADIDESLLHQHMSLGDLPEPDLLIRTGGDFRVSNFLLWDIAYTELYFTEAFWPEFDGSHLRRAVDTFFCALTPLWAAPLGIEMLLRRVITALCLAAFALVVIFLLPVGGFALMFGIAAGAGVYEWSGFCTRRPRPSVSVTLSFMRL